MSFFLSAFQCVTRCVRNALHCLGRIASTTNGRVLVISPRLSVYIDRKNYCSESGGLVWVLQSPHRTLRNNRLLFDVERYLSFHRECKGHALNAVHHYLTVGEQNHFLPSKCLDLKDFARRNGGDGSVFTAYVEFLLEFFTEKELNELYVLKTSALFDSDWYMEHNAGASSGQFPAAEHFLKLGAHHGAFPSRFFDTAWYLENNKDVAGAGINPLVHYIRSGEKEGRRPNAWLNLSDYARRNGLTENLLQSYAASMQKDFSTTELEWIELLCRHTLFDAVWYEQTYTAVAESHLLPEAHYIREGVKKGYNPSRFFDTAWYLENNKDVAGAGINPLVHYIRSGEKEGRRPNAWLNLSDYARRNGLTENLLQSYAASMQKDFSTTELEWIELLCRHTLFDAVWYEQTYTAAAESHLLPEAHYIREGVKKGYNPSRFFDTVWYLENNKDVAKAEINPLIHYIRHGEKEGRCPNSWLNLTDYARRNNLSENIVLHYSHAVLSKLSEKRLGELKLLKQSRLFNREWYVSTYKEAAESPLPPEEHFLLFGANLGYKPSRFFDTVWYLENNKDVAQNNTNPLVHYIQCGEKENRCPIKGFDVSYFRNLKGWKENVLLLYTQQIESRIPILNKIRLNNHVELDESDLDKIDLRIKGQGNRIIIRKMRRCAGRLLVSINGDGNTLEIGDGLKISEIVNIHIGFFPNNYGPVQDVHVSIGSMSGFERTTIQTCNSHAHISIGERCMFSYGVNVYHTDAHPIFDIETGELINKVRTLKIGNHVWVGANATITKNVHIADNCIIGWGAVVGKSCSDSNCVLAGNPARIVRRNINWSKYARIHGYIDNE